MKHANERVRLAVRWRMLTIDATEIHLETIRQNTASGIWNELPRSWDRLMAIGVADARALQTLRKLARRR